MTPHRLADLDPFPICLGGNVFGWTADERESFAVLDAYWEAGGNFIDTADCYSAGGPGVGGGDSERIIGRWLTSRRNRNEIIVGTKVGAQEGAQSLAPEVIRQAVEASLKRLQVDQIDIYYAHLDDKNTPLEETMATFAELVEQGLVRYLGSCNYGPPRLREALEVAARHGLPSWIVVQYQYNLVEREGYEAELQDICAEASIPCVPYFGLARGFLTGKYRPGGQAVDSARAEKASAYLNDERSMPLLAALDDIAANHETSVAAISLAWLRSQPTVISPQASARTVGQLSEILPAADITLSSDERAVLDAITSPAADAMAP